MCAHLPGLPIEPCFRVREDRLPQLPRLDLRVGLCLLRFHQRNPRAALVAHAARAAGTAATADRDIAPGRRTDRWPRNFVIRGRAGTGRLPAMTPRPMVSIAATMRPLRSSSRSASETIRIFGVAVGEARRSACAICLRRDAG